MDSWIDESSKHQFDLNQSAFLKQILNLKPKIVIKWVNVTYHCPKVLFFSNMLRKTVNPF